MDNTTNTPITTPSAMYSSAELNKLLRQLNDDITRFKQLEKKSATFTCSANEDVESARPANFDFEENRRKIEKYGIAQRYIRHKINVFNATTLLTEYGFDMTIDQMLMYLPYLTETKSTLERYAANLPKERKVNGALSRESGPEYIYVNYDLKKVADQLEEIRDELASAQLALDEINMKYLIDMGEGFSIENLLK